MIVGRGGKRGKTSGRGGKGQTARSGHKKRPELRDFIKRIPKLRGRGVSGLRTIQTKPFVLNIEAIEKVFDVGSEVSLATLIEKKLISTQDGRIPVVKILASGEITKKLNIIGCKFSASTKAKVEKVGGSVKA